MTKGKLITLDAARRTPDLRRLLRENAGLQRLIDLKVDLADGQQVSAACSLLVHREGEGELVQDIKSMVIRRLSLEALSRSWVTLKDLKLRTMRQEFNVTAERIFALLKGFPAVEHLEHFSEVPMECFPAKEDGADILRAKREGLLYYLTKIISCCLADQQVILSPFNKTTFFDLYGTEIMTLGDHARSPLTPKPIADCLKQHVLETETGLPFNISLPD
jgi:hypothetical protein